jgi:hypothetical protein
LHSALEQLQKEYAMAINQVSASGPSGLQCDTTLAPAAAHVSLHDDDKSSMSKDSTNWRLPKFPLAVEEGSYVLLQMLPQGKRKIVAVFYVGCVTSRENNGWKIKCLRRYKGHYLNFFYIP